MRYAGRGLRAKTARGRSSAMRRIAVGAAALLALAGAIAWAAVQAAGEADGSRQARPAAVTLEVEVFCEGWSDGSPLGVFVSGFSLDGRKVEEHLVLEGPGTASVPVQEGFYEASLQRPLAMSADGAVFSAGDPATVRVDGSAGSSRVALSYAAVDAAGLSDDDLSAIARESFADEAQAQAALERARERRAGKGEL